MLLRTSQDSLKVAFEYFTKLPFSKRILHKLSEIARGKCIAFFFLHRLLDDSQKTHPHFLNKSAMTVKEARLLLSHIKSFLPFVPLGESLDLLSGEKPIARSHAVLLIEVPYQETMRLLKPLLEEMAIPATVVLDTRSLSSGQMPWTDEILFRFGNTDKKEICTTFIDRTFPLRTASERLIAAHHFIENLSHANPQTIISRMEQLRRALGEDMHFSKQEKILALPELIKLEKKHIISFASAGRMRLPLYEMDAEQAYEEIILPKQELSALFPSSFCPVFIHPWFSYKRKNKEMTHILMDGFRAAISRTNGVCRPGDNLFQLKSLSLAMGKKSFEQFELQGLSDAIDEFLLVTLAQEEEI